MDTAKTVTLKRAVITGLGAITPVGNRVNYISAHATSTPLGDLSEIKAIEKLFASHYGNFSVSAIKSATGHLLGAAGALAAISCVKSIQEQIIPPTINTTSPAPEIPTGLNLTLGTAQQRPVAAAMNNAFGFGGHCTSAVFATCDGR